MRMEAQESKNLGNISCDEDNLRPDLMVRESVARYHCY